MPRQINHQMTPTEWALLILLAILWGGSYFYNAIAIKELPPLIIVAVRVGLGAALLYLVVRLTGGRMPREWTTWRAFFFMGLINNVIPFSLVAWSQTHIASGLAAILNATTPLFTVLVAHYATHDEKMSPGRIVGLLVGFAGVVLMIGPDAITESTNDVIAEFGPLGAAVFYAASGVYGRRFSRMGLKPLVTATGQITAAAVMMIPLALLIDPPWLLQMPGLETWAALFGLAAVSTTLAYVIFYRILSTAGAVNLLLVTFLVPVSAILLGAVILHEHLGVNHFLGMACIGLGLAAIDGRLVRLLWPARA